MNEEIISGNKIIAVFDGGVIQADAVGHLKRNIFFRDMKMGLHLYNAEMLCYHSSFDWLMPVVEKIEKLGYKTVLATSECGCKYYQNISTGVGIIKETVNNPSKFMGQSESKIEAVWIAVVPFINWYNNNKKD